LAAEEKRLKNDCVKMTEKIYFTDVYPLATQVYRRKLFGDQSFYLPVNVQKWTFDKKNGEPFEEVHEFEITSMPTPTEMKLSIGRMVGPFDKPDQSKLKLTTPVARLTKTTVLEGITPNYSCLVRFQAKFDNAKKPTKDDKDKSYYTAQLDVTYGMLINALSKVNLLPEEEKKR
jgi:hypothetical protein